MTHFFQPLKRLIYIVLSGLSMGTMPMASPQNATNEAVIVLLHRFAQTTHPSTNITAEQLKNFIAYMQDNAFNVLPLSDVVHAVQTHTPLREKTVVITIDDAYKSVYTHAYPAFKQAGFPFTVFLSSREVGGKNFLSWDQVSEMAKNGVDFQAHTHSHPKLQKLPTAEVIKEIKTNVALITKHTGTKPRLFAYPYGEASTDVINTVKNMGFQAGFSQHSGVFNATSDMFYIPRFSLNERYATGERIRLILNARAFPVQQFIPNNPHITATNPPTIQFSVSPAVKTINNVNCFYNGTGTLTIKKHYPTVTLTFDTPFNTGRTRINCTARHPDNRGYRWLGMQYVK